MSVTNEREAKGLEIAARCKIKRKGNAWIVPSQSGNGRYTVVPDAVAPHCSCPDHETRGVRCKHLFAVDFVMKREENEDGSETITQAVVVTETVRKTYAQNWPAYNEAQTHEKEKFLSLLRDLCAGIHEPEQKKGRKRVPRADGIFCAAFKVYSGFSARRFMTDVRTVAEDGFIGKPIHFNSVLKFLENPELTPILKAMIVEASRPLGTVEVDFATDSTGFTTCFYERWYDHKYGTPRSQHDWCKIHLTCGVKTNIVSAIVVEDRNAADCKQMPEMVKTTAQNFKVREFSADKAYGTHEIYAAVDEVGATPFIAFKSSATGWSGGLWAKMFHYFQFRKEEFLGHYHKRSNVESTMSMIKRKFGDSLRSKTEVAMVNESLLKVLCHNIVVLIHEMYELGIEPVFWTEKKEEAKAKSVLPMIPA